MPDDDEFADASDETPGEDDGADEAPEPVLDVLDNWAEYLHGNPLERADALFEDLLAQWGSEDEGGSLFSRHSPLALEYAKSWVTRVELLATQARRRGGLPGLLVVHDGRINADFASTLRVCAPREWRRYGAGHPPRREAWIVLRTPGGDPESAYVAMRYLRRSFRRVHVAIPAEARSAGTLFALGASRIHVGPMGLLGPVDEQIEAERLGIGPSRSRRQVDISVEAALGAFEDVMRRVRASTSPQESMFLREYLLDSGLTAENLGVLLRFREHAKRLAVQMLQLGAKATIPRDVAVVAEHLACGYADHAHGIDGPELQDLLGRDKVRVGSPRAMASDLLLATIDHACIGYPESPMVAWCDLRVPSEIGPQAEVEDLVERLLSDTGSLPLLHESKTPSFDHEDDEDDPLP